MRASQLIPTSLPTLKDPKFVKDREQMTGRSWKIENIEKMRPEAESEIKAAFTFLEETVLADGRQWVLGTSASTLADIEAAWPFVWLQGMPGALEPQVVSEKLFPKTWAWLGRFTTATRTAGKEVAKPKTLNGEEAMKAVGAAEWTDNVTRVHKDDSSGLQAGQLVQIWPIDSGFQNKDQGKLVGLTVQEIVWEAKTAEGKVIRVHTPRTGFRIKALEGEAKL